MPYRPAIYLRSTPWGTPPPPEQVKFPHVLLYRWRGTEKTGDATNR